MSRLNRHHALRVFAERASQDAAFDDAALDELCAARPELEAWLRRIARERAEAHVEVPHVPSPDLERVGGKSPRRARGARSRYVLLGEVARGGMGTILRVWDVVLERQLAMKVLDTANTAKSSSAVEPARARFLTEARIAGRLQHPGVVPIHDLGVDERGRAYFTMPLLEGHTLEQGFALSRTRSEGWSLERALLALSQVCEVVAYAHSRAVIHRDLKPANVVVAEFGAIHVVDWGLAKVLDPLEPEPEPAADPEAADGDGAPDGRTLDGTVAGTPPYMAPEQAEGRAADVSCRADVYAVGAMLYQLLAGRAPYHARHEREEPESPERIVELIRRGAPTPLGRVAPDAPEELIAICERAMSRQPVHRYAGMEDVARDLRAFLGLRADDAMPERARTPAREASARP